MTRIGLLLKPLDSLFFRDGKPFAPGDRGLGGMPAPQTLAGAVRSHLLLQHQADFGSLARVIKQGGTLLQAVRSSQAPEWIAELGVRGPWFADMPKDPDKPIELYLDPPQNLRPGKNDLWIPLQPSKEKIPGWQAPDGLLPIWNKEARPEKGKPPGYLRFSALPDYLQGNALTHSAFRAQQELYAFDEKTGIQVDRQTGTAEEGMIYSARMLALHPAICLYAELLLPPGCDTSNVFARPEAMGFGGESRYVEVRPAPPVNWPFLTGDRQLCLLVSPSLFEKGWRPDRVPPGARIVSAAVGGPFVVSGWDMAAGGPKPTRFGVRPGSVYFLEGGPLDAAHSLCSNRDDRQQGYGFFVGGVWDYA